MDDEYKTALQMQKLKKGLDQVGRHLRIDRMKRWAQQQCERCGEPLETAFDEHGRNPIRICWRCEMKDQWPGARAMTEPPACRPPR
jgi:hypothetical protein